jgi:hypothetical protein
MKRVAVNDITSYISQRNPASTMVSHQHDQQTNPSIHPMYTQHVHRIEIMQSQARRAKQDTQSADESVGGGDSPQKVEDSLNALVLPWFRRCCGRSELGEARELLRVRPLASTHVAEEIQTTASVIALGHHR